MYQVFGFAIAPYIDKNGLPHTPRIIVTPDVMALIREAAPLLTELVEQITGEEQADLNVAATIAHHIHGINPDSVMDLFEALELGDLDEQYDQAPKVYLGIGSDEDDLEDKLIDLVGEPDDEDDLDEAFLEEEGDLEEDDED